ncbi:MAG: hypothetical protein JWM10_4165 [Myxococcaceae bacterium]|nr:hypothetical protein [Myxococcaceae bacterium]
MPEPWDATDEEMRAEVERLRPRRLAADHEAAPLLSAQLAEFHTRLEEDAPGVQPSDEPTSSRRMSERSSLVSALRLMPWHGESETAYDFVRGLIQHAGLLAQRSVASAGVGAEHGLDAETPDGVRWTFCVGSDTQSIEVWAMSDEQAILGRLEIHLSDEEENIEAIEPSEDGVFSLSLRQLRELASHGGSLRLIHD